MSRRKFILFGTSAVVSIILGFVNLESTPPVWWDEGWTLLVARTWIEQGVYGRLLDGAFIPPILAATYPTTMMVGLAFRLFGVGLWQARLVGVVSTLAALVVWYHLVRLLYNRRLAFGTLFALFFMTMHPQAHLIVMGREVLAEPPMLFFLLAGYLSLLFALQRSAWFLWLAALLWGFGLVTKGQAYPFWTMSICVPLLVVILRRRWKLALVLALGWLGGYAFSQAIVILVETMLRDQFPPFSVVAVINDLNTTLAIVPVLANRWLAIRIVWAFALPTALGFGYMAVNYLRRWRLIETSSVEIVRLSVFIFAGTWFAWYLLLANAGIPRYLYPPVFIGSAYVAILLSDLTNDYDLRGTIHQASNALRHLQFGLSSLRALLAIALLAIAVPFALMILAWFYWFDSSNSAYRVADYLNQHTGANALIETYDSELFFLLERRFHYPPDQAHVNLIRRTLDPSVRVDYDPLAADPDYLVVGPFSEGWHVYDTVLAPETFRPIFTEEHYRVYERVRGLERTR